MIAFGLVSAVFGYFRDADLFDLIDMMNAGYFAVLHAVLWTIGGAAVIFWYNAGPGGSPPYERDNDKG